MALWVLFFSAYKILDAYGGGLRLGGFYVFLAAIIMHIFLLFLWVDVVSVAEERRREFTGKQGGDYVSQASLGLDRKILVTYPGERIGFSIRINGPPQHVVGVEIRGIPPIVAEALVSPSKSVTPYTAEVSLIVSEGAEPGLYPFHVVIYNYAGSRLIGEEKLGLLVLPRELTLRHYAEARRIYRYEGLGAQGVLWYLIAKVYRGGASFTELKRAYELVRGGPVRKATIANIVKRMIKKGLIRKGEDGRYCPLVTKPEVAFSRIDKSRVRIWKSGRAQREE